MSVTRETMQAMRANIEAKIGSLAYSVLQAQRTVADGERQIHELEGQHALCEQALRCLDTDEAVEKAKAGQAQAPAAS